MQLFNKMSFREITLAFEIIQGKKLLCFTCDLTETAYSFLQRYTVRMFQK